MFHAIIQVNAYHLIGKVVYLLLIGMNLFILIS